MTAATHTHAHHCVRIDSDGLNQSFRNLLGTIQRREWTALYRCLTALKPMIQSTFAHLNDHPLTLSTGIHDVKARLLWILSSSLVSIKRPTEGKRRHLPMIRNLSTENSMKQKPDQRILEVASWDCLALTLSNLPGTIGTIL